MKVILYPRVSSKKQAQEGDSIDAQTNRLTKFCKDNDFEIVGVYSDAGKSASIKEDKRNIKITNDSLSITFNLNQRPALKEIMNIADKEKFNAICFYKWDRYSRDVVFAKISQQYFESKGIKLIPSDDSQDPLASSIMQILSEEEIRKMKERVRLSRIQRFEKGVMVGKASIGYKFNSKKKIMVIDDKKAKMVKEIFERTSKGESYRWICQDFKISPQTYYNILKNKIYIGIISFENIEREGTHEHIISKELFNKVNKNG